MRASLVHLLVCSKVSRFSSRKCHERVWVTCCVLWSVVIQNLCRHQAWDMTVVGVSGEDHKVEVEEADGLRMVATNGWLSIIRFYHPCVGFHLLNNPFFFVQIDLSKRLKSVPYCFLISTLLLPN